MPKNEQPSDQPASNARPPQHPDDQRLQKVEKDFYWSRHDGSSSERRQKLEREWNELKHREAEREGRKWTYKHDRRDNFTFTRETNRRGESVNVRAQGRIDDPRTTINWRDDTAYGKSRERQVRNRVAGKSGDDAGHLIPAQFGADPEGVNSGGVDWKLPNALEPRDRLNYARQNRKMNQEVGWYDVEMGVAKHARKNQMKGERGELHIDVKCVHSRRSIGGEREQHRTMTVTDNGKPINVTTSQGKQAKAGNYIAGNFSTPQQRSAQSARQDSGPTPPRTPGGTSGGGRPSGPKVGR